MATIIHELTHLVRKTEDYDSPPLSDDDFRFVTTEDLISVTREQAIAEKRIDSKSSPQIQKRRALLTTMNILFRIYLKRLLFWMKACLQ